MKKYAYLLTVTGILLNACASTDTAESRQVDQDGIYQHLTADFDMDKNLASYTAVFSFGGSTGTTLKLSPPSTVKVNGTDMNAGKLLLGGASYHLSGESAGADKEQSFEFKDTKGKSYINSFHFINPGEIGYPATLEKGQSFSVVWERPLHKNESAEISVQIENKIYSEITSAEGSQKLTIPLDPKEIKTGKAVFPLVFSYSGELEKGTSENGRLDYSTISKEYEFTIVPAETQSYQPFPMPHKGVDPGGSVPVIFNTKPDNDSLIVA